jgi:transcriptional regulatory protein RtcR
MKVSFNREARRRYLSFSTAAEAEWASNFRDLGASITRMATLAPGGRINETVVAEEIERLARQWSAPALA